MLNLSLLRTKGTHSLKLCLLHVGGGLFFTTRVEQMMSLLDDSPTRQLQKVPDRWVMSAALC